MTNGPRMTLPREILFRGFHPCGIGDTVIVVDGEEVNGIWKYGYVFEKLPPLQCVTNKSDCAPSMWFILQTGFADWNMPRPIEFLPVLPETVGGFTGLEDKNGNMIFEGDRVSQRELAKIGYWNKGGNWTEKDGESYLGTVKYSAPSFSLFFDDKRRRPTEFNPNEEFNDMNSTVTLYYEYEVVGTIWDKETIAA